jgi:hypothetical protein
VSCSFVVLCGAQTHVSLMLGRGTWDVKKTFYGHKQPTSVVRFCPVVYKSSAKSDSYFCPAAVGSMDKTITVWLPNRDRPLLLIEGFLQQSVLDLCWYHASTHLPLVTCVRPTECECGVGVGSGDRMDTRFWRALTTALSLSSGLTLS